MLTDNRIFLDLLGVSFDSPVRMFVQELAALCGSFRRTNRDTREHSGEDSKMKEFSFRFGSQRAYSENLSIWNKAAISE